jgi:catechol 2,3-dioxygenase
MAAKNDPLTTAACAVDPRVRIGHVHLKVADLPRAVAFYAGGLGLEVMQRYGDGRYFYRRADTIITSP